MNSRENSLTKLVQSLALLGPFMMMVTLTALLISPVHQQLYLPLLALIGIPLCWKWKYSGLWASLALLSAILFYQLFFSSSPERIFWELLVAAALALTFAITALSYKEVEEVLIEVHHTSTSNMQSFLEANERAQLLEERHLQELHHEIAKSKQFEQKLNEQVTLTQTNEEAAERLRDKMNVISLQNESLLRELFQKRHECEKLSQEIKDQVELSQMELDDQKKAYQSLKEEREAFAERNQKEIENLLSQVAVLKSAKTEHDDRKNSIEALNKETQSLEESHRREIATLQNQINQLKAAKKELPKAATASAPQTSEASKVVAKSKPGKGSKTNDWANTILSRWSEPHDLPQ